MAAPDLPQDPPAAGARRTAPLARAAHLIPAQGPVTVFIHHNTLHAFEHLPLEQTVERGAAVVGCEPYPSENRYSDAPARGRIRFADLRAVLEEELGPGAEPPRGARPDIRLARLQYPIATGSAAEPKWLLAETDAPRVRPEAPAAADRYRGRRDHLEFSEVAPGRTGTAGGTCGRVTVPDREGVMDG